MTDKDESFEIAELEAAIEAGDTILPREVFGLKEKEDVSQVDSDRGAKDARNTDDEGSRGSIGEEVSRKIIEGTHDSEPATEPEKSEEESSAEEEGDSGPSESTRDDGESVEEAQEEVPEAGPSISSDFSPGELLNDDRGSSEKPEVGGPKARPFVPGGAHKAKRNISSDSRRGTNKIRIAGVNKKTSQVRGNRGSVATSETPEFAEEYSKKTATPEEASEQREEVLSRRGVFVPNPKKPHGYSSTAQQTTIRDGQGDHSSTYRKGKKDIMADNKEYINAITNLKKILGGDEQAMDLV